MIVSIDPNICTGDTSFLFADLVLGWLTSGRIVDPLEMSFTDRKQAVARYFPRRTNLYLSTVQVDLRAEPLFPDQTFALVIGVVFHGRLLGVP